VDTNSIDLSKIQFSILLRDRVFFAGPDSVIGNNVIPYLKFNRPLPSKTTAKNVYIKLALYNSSDSVQEAYFSPGLYFTSIQIFKSSVDELQKGVTHAEKIKEDENISAGFVLLSLKPKESAVFFLDVSQLKAGVISISPQIINKNFINYFRTNLSNRPINRVTYVVSGILLMMIFYSLGVYFQDSKSEFLYYSIYAFFIGLLIFLKSYLYNNITLVNYYFEGCVDFILQGGGFVFYIGFFRTFLQTAKEHPLLEKVFRTCQWITIGLLIIFSITWFFTSSFFIPDAIENVTKLLLIALSIFFIVYGLSKKDKLINYLVTGQIMLIIFSIISFVMVITEMPIFNKDRKSLFNASMLYYEIGVVFELTFFLAALAYKNKKDISERAKESERLKLDNERKEFDKQIAVLEAQNNERNRISADMHDELGSGVTAIRLMSEIVKSKMKNQSLPEIEKISYSANELLDKMNAIIWTMISSNDSAESLITYIRAYAVDFFESTLIDCHVNMPSYIPATEINGEKRRNIFLSVKEALNNVLKHAHASNVTINITIDKNLVIEICDDGKGIDTDNLRKFGNGINNMKKRIESIDGEMSIQNDNGTKLIFILKM